MPASLRFDCCSPALRNAVRLPSGIDVHLHRNTQAEAQAAVALAPNDVFSQYVLGDGLMRLKRTEEGKQALQRALNLTQMIYPRYQAGWVPYLKKQIAK